MLGSASGSALPGDRQQRGGEEPLRLAGPGQRPGERVGGIRARPRRGGRGDRRPTARFTATRFAAAAADAPRGAAEIASGRSAGLPFSAARAERGDLLRDRGDLERHLGGPGELRAEGGVPRLGRLVRRLSRHRRDGFAVCLGVLGRERSDALPRLARAPGDVVRVRPCLAGTRRRRLDEGGGQRGREGGDRAASRRVVGRGNLRQQRPDGQVEDRIDVPAQLSRRGGRGGDDGERGGCRGDAGGVPAEPAAERRGRDDDDEQTERDRERRRSRTAPRAGGRGQRAPRGRARGARATSRRARQRGGAARHERRGRVERLRIAGASRDAT